MINTSKIAEDLFERMSKMKLSDEQGEYAHHPKEFLPANVCCDFAGNARFKNILKEVLDKHLNPKLTCNDCIYIAKGKCERHNCILGDEIKPCELFVPKNKYMIHVACWICNNFNRIDSMCTNAEAAGSDRGQFSEVRDPMLLHFCLGFDQRKG